jgi:hypothetical protein
MWLHSHRITPERIINFTVDKLGVSSIAFPRRWPKMRTEGVEQQKAVATDWHVLKLWRRSLAWHFWRRCALGVLAFGGGCISADYAVALCESAVYVIQKDHHNSLSQVA